MVELLLPVSLLDQLQVGAGLPHDPWRGVRLIQITDGDGILGNTKTQLKLDANPATGSAEVLRISLSDDPVPLDGDEDAALCPWRSSTRTRSKRFPAEFKLRPKSERPRLEEIESA